MSKKIAHAWIRELHPDDSMHRIGCMVAKRLSPTKARIAFSLCAPGDKMDVKKAKRLALRRLTEFKSKAITVDVTTLNGAIDWAEVLQIAQTADKHFIKNGRVYAEDRNQNAIMGLLSEVCPVK